VRRHYSLPLDGGGRGGGDFHLSLCPARAWLLVVTTIALAVNNGVRKGLARYKDQDEKRS